MYIKSFEEFLNEKSKTFGRKQGSWNDDEYSNFQMGYISLGRGSNKEYGNIDDLDPKVYNGNQMQAISLGRGSNRVYGNIDDLDPKEYGDQMIHISLGRGSNKRYGNIDDLDPNEYNDYQMGYISLGRGSDKSYGNIDDLDPKKYSADKMIKISNGRASGKLHPLDPKRAKEKGYKLTYKEPMGNIEELITWNDGTVLMRTLGGVPLGLSGLSWAIPILNGRSAEENFVKNVCNRAFKKAKDINDFVKIVTKDIKIRVIRTEELYKRMR